LIFTGLTVMRLISISKLAEAFKEGFQKEVMDKAKKVDEHARKAVERKLNTEPHDVGTAVGSAAGATGGMSAGYHLTRGMPKHLRLLSILSGGTAGLGLGGYTGRQVGYMFE
jgi:hypothetical protein